MTKKLQLGDKEITYKKVSEDIVEETTPVTIEQETRQFSVEKMRKNLPIWENLAQNLDEKIKRAKKIIQIADEYTIS